MADSLEILIVEGEDPITTALATALGKRGYRVATARDVETALALPTPDVVVCEARLSGACGFDLLSAITERGERARSVLLLSEPTVEDCLRAFRLGAAALLTKPFRLADLVRAVEAEEASTRRRPRDETAGLDLPASPAADLEFRRAYAPVPDSMDRCARELVSFCTFHGVPPSTRARIAGAVCEIVDNALRHGELGGSSRIRVEGHFERNWLHVEVQDGGAGFDPRSPGAALPLGPALTGLARAKALSDGLDLSTSPGAGTRIGLRFCVSSVAFPDAKDDLSEADFLTPERARDTLVSLMEGKTPEVTGISPAIAVVLGRLLAGPDPSLLTAEGRPRSLRFP
ncbi:MAG: response regulator [Planctomycetota bacterium]